jgi:Fungal specific transcription factor domain
MKDNTMEGESENQNFIALNLPEVGVSPQRRQRPPVAPDLRSTRAHLRIYGKGIFKPPPPYRQIGTQPKFTPALPELPSKAMAEHLLNQYYLSIHSVIPILHWPSFVKEFEAVYRVGSLQGVPPVWSSLLFSVFACGALHTIDHSIDRINDGKRYIEFARCLIDLWNDEFSIDHVRGALLTSIFLTEMNLKSAAWVWLGSAIRISQDIGLHTESAPWPVIETEMRRRVWWGVYVWDRYVASLFSGRIRVDKCRLLSLELGRPLQIDDHDCDVSLPALVDDRYISDDGIKESGPSENTLLTIIHIVRTIGPLIKTLKAPVMSPHTLSTFNKHFAACTKAFPEQCHLNSSQYLEPRYLEPICHLQNVRLLLHRHNLSTSCIQEARAAAVENCVGIAKDTAHLLSRTMQQPPSSPQYQHPSTNRDWQSLLSATASTLLCTHIWRCILFLCFRGHYTEALTCVHVSASIGNLREINIACGRNLSFFLRTMMDRLSKGFGVSELEKDEEMMALVSGDLQGTTDNSWVWQGSEKGMELNTLMEQGSTLVHETPLNGSNTSQQRPGSGQGFEAIPQTTILTPEDVTDWGGWPYIVSMLRQLLENNGNSYTVQPYSVPATSTLPTLQQYGSLSSGNYTVQGSAGLGPSAPPMTPVPIASMTPATTAPSPSSRISIANII